MQAEGQHCKGRRVLQPAEDAHGRTAHGGAEVPGGRQEGLRRLRLLEAHQGLVRHQLDDGVLIVQGLPDLAEGRRVPGEPQRGEGCDADVAVGIACRRAHCGDRRGASHAARGLDGEHAYPWRGITESCRQRGERAGRAEFRQRGRRRSPDKFLVVRQQVSQHLQGQSEVVIRCRDGHARKEQEPYAQR